MLAITGTIVTPVVGFIKNIRTVEEVKALQASASQDEVSSIFSVTIDQLMDPRTKGYEELHRGPLMPYWTCGTERIWGLTAYIADEMLELVFASAFGSANAKHP